MKKFLKMEYAALRHGFFRNYKQMEEELKQEFKADSAYWGYVVSIFPEMINPQQWVEWRLNEVGLHEVVLTHTVKDSEEEKGIQEWVDSCRETEEILCHAWKEYRRPLLAFAWKNTLVGGSRQMASDYEENRKKGAYGKRAAGEEHSPENEPITLKKFNTKRRK
jgi:hypothetical protein